MKELSVDELAALIEEKADIQIIDVRENEEYQQGNIGAVHIPLQTIPQNMDKIEKDKQVVIHCRSGKRSANAIAYLEQNGGFDNLYNLEGGMLAWKQEIDETLDVE